MSDMASLLDSIYNSDQRVSPLEKTAEAAMLEQLGQSGQTAGALRDMSTAELIALATQLEADEGTEKTASAQPAAAEPEDTSELEKVAYDTFGGQLMAHAFTHELGLMKVAMINGKCRVCKENAMDIQGSSICSACHAEADSAE